MRSRYFYVPGSDSLLFGLAKHTGYQEPSSVVDWQCDVGPGDIAYTYVPDRRPGARHPYLRREEVPFQRAPRWRRRP